MGANIFHAGAHGNGQVAKICNNLLLAVQMTGTAESLALGVANGLKPEVLSEIMKQSSGGNWALNVYNPYPGVMDGVALSGKRRQCDRPIPSSRAASSRNSTKTG